MAAIHCACGAVVPVAALLDVRVWTSDGGEMIGGGCPLCGSTRYAPAAEVERADVEMCPGVELLGDGRLCMARDLDAAVAEMWPDEADAA